ncbi:MAG: sce7726 family protein [Acidimicrobiales bacterium]
MLLPKQPLAPGTSEVLEQRGVADLLGGRDAMGDRPAGLDDLPCLNYHPEDCMSRAVKTAADEDASKASRATREPGMADADIRPALREYLWRCHGHDTDTVLVEELGLLRGRVRVDLAVVNGSLHGYEIKSDRDSLRRLGVQVDLYGQVLDRATLVVGDRFAPLATSLVPAWWGVVKVTRTASGPRFTMLRRSKLNRHRNPRVLAELLWSDQVLALLERRGAARGMRGKPRRVLWDRLCECFSVDEIAAAVRQRLKATPDSEVHP